MTVTAHVHRFQDYVAVSFAGMDGETVYLTLDDARQQADAIRQCVDDIDARPFVESRFPTTAIPLTNDGSRFK